VNFLRGWGVHLEREGGVLHESFQIWTSDGQMLASAPLGRDGQPNKDIVSVHGIAAVDGDTHTVSSQDLGASVRPAAGVAVGCNGRGWAGQTMQDPAGSESLARGKSPSVAVLDSVHI
jgi:hypothetical protein